MDSLCHCLSFYLNGSVFYYDKNNYLFSIKKTYPHFVFSWRRRQSLCPIFLSPPSWIPRRSAECPHKHKNPRNRSCGGILSRLSNDYLFRAVATSTAQATVQPTIGLLPIPRKPIISTWAGTDEDPANWASLCIRPIVSVIP